jgi:argininosuccinate lyase
MTTLWSGRFASAPDAEALEFGSSFRFDKRLFEDDVTGSLAWARALAKADVLSSDEARAIEQALGEILDKGRSDPAWVHGGDEDVHSFVERELVARLGDTGRRLHTGRTKTCTASSNASSWRASATRDAACTPAVRGTNRCRSICASISGGAFRGCNAPSPS